MIAGNIVVQAFGSLFFFARVYSRVAITRAWRAEDYILTLAWVSSRNLRKNRKNSQLTPPQLFCTAYSICQYGQIDNGAGRHAIATSMENPQAPITSQKYAYAAQIILFPALSLPKLSICLTYLRLFYLDKRGRYMIQALVVILVLLIVPFDFEVAFQCWPVHVYWTDGRPAAKCIKDFPGFLLSGTLNVFVDVALIAIVLPRILELRLHQRQRWALTGIVLLGSLAVVAGIVRMVRVSTALKMPDFEPSWDSYDVSIWTSTEIYVSLLCASAPGIKPVIKKVMPKLLGSSFSSRTQTDGRTGTGIELGLSSKWKRTTIGSTRINRRLSETMLTTADGPYTQVGGGVDARSLSRGSEESPGTAMSGGESSLSRGSEESPGTAMGGGENIRGGHIYKTSGISIQTHAI